MRRYVEIRNSRGKIRFGPNKPYLLEILEGAGNINSSVVTSRSPHQHGESSHGATYNMRTLMLKVGIIGTDKTDTDRLYRETVRKLISTEISTLIYKNYHNEYKIQGRITAVDQAERKGRLQFLVIQIDCYNPFWADTRELKEEISLWKPVFEFPCYFEEPVELGVRVDNLIMNVENKGDVEAGMTIVFKCNGTVVNPSLLNIETQEYLKLLGEFKSGDTITVTTHFANLTATLNRDNEDIKILHYLDSRSTFLQLDLGDNIFRYDAKEGLGNLDLSIYHNNNYLGV